MECAGRAQRSGDGAFELRRESASSERLGRQDVAKRRRALLATALHDLAEGVAAKTDASVSVSDCNRPENIFRERAVVPSRTSLRQGPIAMLRPPGWFPAWPAPTPNAGAATAEVGPTLELTNRLWSGVGLPPRAFGRSKEHRRLRGPQNTGPVQGAGPSGRVQFQPQASQRPPVPIHEHADNFPLRASDTTDAAREKPGYKSSHSHGAPIRRPWDVSPMDEATSNAQCRHSVENNRMTPLFAPRHRIAGPAPQAEAWPAARLRPWPCFAPRRWCRS